MTFSLPEERALAGKADPLGVEPIKLDPHTSDLARYRDRAQQVLDTGAKFTADDLHAILARIVVGIES